MHIQQEVSPLSRITFKGVGISLASVGFLLVDHSPQKAYSASELPRTPVTLPEIALPLMPISLATQEPIYQEVTLPKVNHQEVLFSSIANQEERLLALEVLAANRQSRTYVYKFLQRDEIQNYLINDPKSWSPFYQKFIEALAPDYQVAGTQVGGHFFRFVAKNGTVDLRIQSMKAWFDLGGDFGELSQVHNHNTSINSCLNPEETKTYLDQSKRLFGDSILQKINH